MIIYFARKNDLSTPNQFKFVLTRSWVMPRYTLLFSVENASEEIISLQSTRIFFFRYFDTELYLEFCLALLPWPCTEEKIRCLIKKRNQERHGKECLGDPGS